MSKLQQEIEAKRAQMIEAGMELGFTHEKTVALSQELDKLLNKYQQEQISKQISDLLRGEKLA